MVYWSAQKLATPRVEGSHPGPSVFFRSGDCYDATLAAKTIQLRKRNAAKQDVWGLNEGGSGENKMDWPAGESGME